MMRCTHPKGHSTDNQGLCHNCGIPINLDGMIEYYGPKMAQEIWDNYRDEQKKIAANGWSEQELPQ